MTKTLVFGFGNPGRLDDGLGSVFADRIEALNLEDVTVDRDYQLNVEDAALVAEHDVVIFADASVACSEPFSLQEITPKASLSFTSHDVSPEAVLSLAGDLFGGAVKGYMLGIRGYEFNEFEERLSSKAEDNLDEAVSYIEKALRADDIKTVGSEYEETPDCDEEEAPISVGLEKG